MTLEEHLRSLISEIVRDELAKALAQMSRPDEYLTTGQAGELAKVVAGTVRRWVKEGRLGAHRAGRSVRVRRAELEQLLARGIRSPSAAPPPRIARTPEQLAAARFGSG